MAVPHASSLPAILIAGATGLVALARSITEAPAGRSQRETTKLAKDDFIVVRGSLTGPLSAGKPVRCVVAARDEAGAPDRLEREGVIVELQPTRGRYCYQDVAVVIAKSDLPPAPATGWYVAQIA